MTGSLLGEKIKGYRRQAGYLKPTPCRPLWRGMKPRDRRDKGCLVFKLCVGGWMRLGGGPKELDGTVCRYFVFFGKNQPGGNGRSSQQAASAV
jgi:hypothetical protein